MMGVDRTLLDGVTERHPWDQASAELRAAAKSETVAKAEQDDLMHALFGGPPRNRHERRKWAKLQKTKRAR